MTNNDDDDDLGMQW